MTISYEPLRQTLEERGMTYYKLGQIAKLDDRDKRNLRQNRNVSMTLKKLERICKALDVPVEKVIKII